MDFACKKKNKKEQKQKTEKIEKRPQLSQNEKQVLSQKPRHAMNVIDCDYNFVRRGMNNNEDIDFQENLIV